MDQTQEQIDPEVAQELIALLNKKIANLRNENAQLQNQLSRASTKEETGAHGVSDDKTQQLLEEIEYWKSELERRPGPEEVASLEEKLKRSKLRRQELEQKLRSLGVELEDSESERRTVVAVKEALEKEVEKLCHTLNETTREKEAAIAQLESPTDAFDLRGFLDGRLVKLPSRAKPKSMNAEEKRRFKDAVVQRGREFFSTSVPHGIIWADEGGGCVVPLPSVLYNGKSQASEPLRDKPVANHSYEFCGVDERNQHRTYHGTYRCIKVVTIDWEQLMFLDQEHAKRFLGRVVIESGFAPPVFVSFVQRLYKTGALKINCVVLRREGSDVKTLTQAKKHSKNTKAPSSRTSGKRKRPRDQQNQERAEGSNKKPRLKN